MINKFKKWFEDKDRRSWIFLLSGIGILLASVTNGESFMGQIPLACIFVIVGVFLSPSNN